MVSGSTSALPPVVLIGPVCVGKSTIGGLLAERLALPHRSLDEVAWSYYTAEGWPAERFRAVLQEQGLLAAQRQFAPALAASVERFLAARAGEQCVIDLGAGHTHFEDSELFARVRRALAPFPRIVLLLPSPDLDHSVRTLRERNDARGHYGMGGWRDGDYDFIEHWTKDRCNFDLATDTIFTDNRTPEQTRDEIVALIRGGDNRRGQR